jgi:hydrogenase maturation protease
VGNPLRRDDGVGWLVAQHLTRLGGEPLASTASNRLEVRTLRGDAAELVEAWKGVDTVVLIDAGRSGSPAGTIHHFDAVRDGLPAHWESASTHGMGVAAAVEIARALGWLPRRLTVYAVEGHDFTPGTELSSEVLRAAFALVERLEESGPD